MFSAPLWFVELSRVGQLGVIALAAAWLGVLAVGVVRLGRFAVTRWRRWRALHDEPTLEVPPDPYKGMEHELAEKLRYNDRVRTNLVAGRSELELIFKMARALNFVVSMPDASSTRVTAWVALGSYKEDLAPALRWMARHGWRVKGRVVDKSTPSRDITFHQDGNPKTITVYFTSKSCKRVVVRTETRTETVPIYETVCE